MKGFLLDSDGDLVIENNRISFIEDKYLTGQTIVSVLRTNKGEWFLNPDEGIKHRKLLGKPPTEETARGEVQGGIRQVDDKLRITQFSMSKDERFLNIEFTADNGTTKITGGTSYAR